MMRSTPFPSTQNWRNHVITAVAVASLLSAVTARAASQDECSIWLCLPGGFPSGCEKAKKAMKHRLHHGKSALPDWSKCIIDGPKKKDPHPSQLAYHHGVAAFIPTHHLCLDIQNHAGPCSGGTCRWQTCNHWGQQEIPATHSKDTSCAIHHSGPHKEPWNNKPVYCSRTDTYHEVWVDGTQTGTTYYDH